AELPPYAQLLLDVLSRNAALSIRADEAEESWRVVTPVLQAWSEERVPLEEYPAGSDGPSPTRRAMLHQQPVPPSVGISAHPGWRRPSSPRSLPTHRGRVWEPTSNFGFGFRLGLKPPKAGRADARRRGARAKARAGPGRTAASAPRPCRRRLPADTARRTRR